MRNGTLYLVVGCNHQQTGVSYVFFRPTPLPRSCVVRFAPARDLPRRDCLRPSYATHTANAKNV